jgi:hypothetical protein
MLELALHPLGHTGWHAEPIDFLPANLYETVSGTFASALNQNAKQNDKERTGYNPNDHDIAHINSPFPSIAD